MLNNESSVAGTACTTKLTKSTKFGSEPAYEMDTQKNNISCATENTEDTKKNYCQYGTFSVHFAWGLGP